MSNFYNFTKEILDNIVGVNVSDLDNDDFQLLCMAIQHDILVVNNNKVEYRNTSIQLTTEEVKIGMENGKLEAVKAYKVRTGCGLLESKKAVENHFEKHNLKFFVKPLV